MELSCPSCGYDYSDFKISEIPKWQVMCECGKILNVSFSLSTPKVVLTWKEAWRQKHISFFEYLCGKSYTRKGVCEEIWERFVRRKEIVTPEEAEVFNQKMLKRNTGRWRSKNRLYVYYGNRNIRKFDPELFSKYELKDKKLAMLKVVKLEIEYKKNGRDGLWD